MKKIFGWSVLSKEEKEKYDEVNSRELKFRAMNLDYQNEITGLRMKIRLLEKSDKVKEYIKVDIGDPSPVDTEKRREYVAKVAGLYKELLEPKLKEMISKSHNILEAPSADREVDLMMKGVIYSFRELLNWGEAMVSEHIASTKGENPSSPEDKK